MTSARSRNIWEFIIFTYFVLFSWLQKYNFSKMNAFGLSLISLFFSCLVVQGSQIHILWNNNLPITFPINIPKALTITKPHYFPNTFTIPSTPINQIFIYHPFLNKYPKTFTILSHIALHTLFSTQNPLPSLKAYSTLETCYISNTLSI